MSDFVGGGCLINEMQPKSDVQLLREYAQCGSDAAFSELVSRHTDLVYSAALRQVDSSDLARDVAQNVFTDLARKARSVVGNLSEQSSLVGWLYRGTRFEALDLRRQELRRHSRERHAMEQLLSTPDNELDWERLRPVIDEAMADLSDDDREALLLRFFKNYDFRAVGHTFGISDDAAQKRVSRALEKLREHLTSRGVAVTAIALAATLSANAVSAAPVGLAATLATGALAGSALTTTAAATTTIAMTTTQKIIVATILAAAVGAGIYQKHEASTLDAQIRTLKEQHKPLVDQMAQLQQERGELTNQLALLQSENARLKASDNSAELRKLRGEVGMLRQRAMSVEAQSNSGSGGFAQMMSDPAMKEFIHRTQMEQVKQRYGDLFRELKLTPEQTAKAIEVMGNTMFRNTETFAAMNKGSLGREEAERIMGQERTQAEGELKSVLGDTGWSRFKEYREEIPAHTTVSMLNGQLADHKLSEDQSSRLFQIVKAEPFEVTHGITGDLDKAFQGSQDEVDNYVNKVKESNERVLQKAGEFLSTDQLQGLSAVLTNGLTLRLTQAAAFVQKK